MLMRQGGRRSVDFVRSGQTRVLEPAGRAAGWAGGLDGCDILIFADFAYGLGQFSRKSGTTRFSQVQKSKKTHFRTPLRKYQIITSYIIYSNHLHRIHLPDFLSVRLPHCCNTRIARSAAESFFVCHD